MLIEFNGYSPKLDPETFVADGAKLIGKVTLERGASIWFNTVVRGDVEPIRIGANTNIQDNCVVHANSGFIVDIGKNVTVGHLTMLHGCRIGDGAVVGMGVTISDGAEIGEDSLVAAHALVPPGFKIPPRSLAVGVPCKVIRELTIEELEENEILNKRYLNR